MGTGEAVTLTRLDEDRVRELRDAAVAHLAARRAQFAERPDSTLEQSLDYLRRKVRHHSGGG
jgi:hypothetical protein